MTQLLSRYGWKGPLPGFPVARVVAEHRGGYVVAGHAEERPASLSGKLRHQIDQGLAEKPAVGDWVEVKPGGGAGVIHRVLPRTSALSRAAKEGRAEPQVLGANVDVVLVVVAVDAELNAHRLDRFLSLAADSGAAFALVLTKVDLCADLPRALARAGELAREVPTHAVSGTRGDGVEALAGYFTGDRTVAFVGSSGVGKSTLANALLGEQRLVTADVGTDGKGRHTSSRRELLLRKDGGLILDTPGLRAVGLVEEESVREAFPEIDALAARCRFSDCRHESEPACAVRAAVDEGALPADRFEHYRALRLEAGTGERVDNRVRSEALRKASVRGKAPARGSRR